MKIKLYIPTTPLLHIKLVTLRCELISRPRLALCGLWELHNMNLGSIIGLGSVCQPFPAGLTTLSGGHQWRSIDPWIQQSRSMDPSVSGSKCPELAPSSLLSLIRSWAQKPLPNRASGRGSRGNGCTTPDVRPRQRPKVAPKVHIVWYTETCVRRTETLLRRN